MVQPALETLTRQLVTLANSPRLSIREMSLSALSSVVSAAEEDFRPYAPEVMTEIARGPLQLTEERHWTIRGRALECVGNIATSIGKEHFEPFMQLSMQCAEQSLQIPDSSELAEYVYSFFGNVSSVMGHDFAPFLDQLCPHLIDIVSRRDHEETSIRSLQGGNPNNVEAMLGATLDDDDDELLRVRGVQGDPPRHAFKECETICRGLVDNLLVLADDGRVVRVGARV